MPVNFRESLFTHIVKGFSIYLFHMSESLTITLLGTGTSQGVPVIACRCRVCASEDERDKRLRSSILVEKGCTRIVVDTGPDFRQQMLKHSVPEISAVLFTHEHKDHVAGLDDIRAYNFILNRSIDVFAEERVQVALKREYAYIFAEEKYPGVPRIEMHTISEEDFRIADIDITPIRAFHHKLPVLGFRIGDFAYLTDVKTIPDKELPKLEGLDTLVLTALRKDPHISHMNLEEALQTVELLKPGMTYLTHLSHAFGRHSEEESHLPDYVRIGYDGMIIHV